MSDKIKVELEGQTIEIEMKNGKFVKPQLLKSLNGFGSGLKPAVEPIILAMKPIEQTYANNALTWGVAGLNIDGGRIGAEGWQKQDRDSPGGFKTGKFLGESGNGKHSQPQDGYRESTQGRWPANVLLSHAEGCVLRGEKRIKGITGGKEPKRSNESNTLVKGIGNNGRQSTYVDYADPNGLETVADWECVEDCAVRLLDEQAGVRKRAEYKSPQGRWPSNVLLSHAEGCVRRGETDKDPESKGPYFYTRNRKGHKLSECDGAAKAPDNYGDDKTVSDWECVDGCPIRILDEQSGESKSRPHRAKTIGKSGLFNKSNDEAFSPYSDSGSASRFFYTSKAPNREKWFYCQLCAQAYPNKERDDHGHDIDQGQRKHIVAHPTVKPLSILKYLCTLTKTPTGGIVLDPFAGSGTTALACIETGRDFILIEKESDYYEIAKARIEAAMSKPRQAELW